MNPILNRLKKYGNLNNEIELQLKKKTKVLVKKKGEFLLKEGQIV